MGKEELLKAANKGMVFDKFTMFNNKLPELGNFLVESGVCISYEIVQYTGKMKTIKLNIKYKFYDQLPKDTINYIHQKFNELVSSCGISKDEWEMCCSGVILDTADTFEMRCSRLNKNLYSLGDRFINEGICKDYKVIRFAGELDSLQADIRPLSLAELPDDVNKRAQQLFANLVYSCGITPDEYEESYAGVEWLTEV